MSPNAGSEQSMAKLGENRRDGPRAGTGLPSPDGSRTCARGRAQALRAMPAIPAYPPPSRRGFRRAIRRSASVRSWSRRARRSSRCRLRAPCATAPMRWIEPTLSPSMMAPSARTRAPWRFLASTSLAPGDDHAALDQFGERHARRVARGHERRERGFRQRLDRGDARFAPRPHRSGRARSRCSGGRGAWRRRRVVPVPLNGIEHEIAGS
mgnify:CR=1 FL=1